VCGISGPGVDGSTPASVGTRFRRSPVFDTSVLLSGLIDLGPSSVPAQRLLTAVATGQLRRVHTAWHCCLEFYAVATRLPEELRLHPRDAWRLVDEELMERFTVHQLPASQHRPFLAVAAEECIVGGRVYDAHIAEIAADFVREIGG
jgi:hypothetical protein